MKEQPMRSFQITALLVMGVLVLVSCVQAVPAVQPSAPPPAASPTQAHAASPSPVPSPTGGETTEPTTTGPEIFLPGTPIPGDKMVDTGPAALDFVQALYEEGKPGKITLNLVGYLPTPCHKLRVEAQPPTPDGQINIRVLAIADPNEICIQIIEPFETSLTVDAPSAGTYSVLVNQMDAGQVTIP